LYKCSSKDKLKQKYTVLDTAISDQSDIHR